MQNTNLSPHRIATVAQEAADQYPDLMVDVETIATCPQAVITELAIVPFYPFSISQAGEEESLILKMNVSQQQRIGRKIYAGTLKWWMDRSPDRLASFLEGGLETSPAAKYISQYISAFNPLRIWSKSPTFDLAIIRNMISYDGKYSVPWTYREERDVRVAEDLYLLTGATTQAVHHNAYDDCVMQIGDVQNLFRTANNGLPAETSRITAVAD